MTKSAPEVMRDWLLCRLSEPESAALEERLFQDGSPDDDLLAAMDAAERDLVDDYVRNGLDADGRAAFERRLLQTVDDRARVAIARALANARSMLSPESSSLVRHRAASVSARLPAPHRTRRWRMALGAGAAALVLIAIFATMRSGRIVAPVAAPASNPAMPTVTLLASVQRGAGERAIELPHGAAWIRLQAEIESPTAGARYDLAVADGAQIVFEVGGLALHQSGPYHYVEASLPASALGPGERSVSVRRHGGDAAFTWNVHTATAPGAAQ